jgi:hypothetical protein
VPHLAVGTRQDAFLAVQDHVELAEEEVADRRPEVVEVLRAEVRARHVPHVEPVDALLHELRVEDPVGVEPEAPHVRQHAGHAPARRQEEHVHLASLEPREHGPRVAARARLGVEGAAVADLVTDQRHGEVQEVGHEQPAVVERLDVDARGVHVEPVLLGALRRSSRTRGRRRT